MNTVEAVTNVGMTMGKRYWNFKFSVLESNNININDILSLKFLKPYFTVDNKYVAHKLRLIIFPFINNENNNINEEIENDSKEGISKNSIAYPDFYIPLMGFITFLLLIGLNLGKDNE